MADPTTTEHPLTREYLDAKLNELRMELLLEMEKLRTEIQRTHADTFKWMMGMFAGLYAVVIGMFAGLYAVIIFK